MQRLQDNLTAVFINAGKSVNSEVNTHMTTDAVSAIEPEWGVIFISESDAMRDDNYSAWGKSVHRHFRHWPGRKSLPMQWIVRQCLKVLISWKFRKC